VDALDPFCIDLLRDLVRTPRITENEKPAQEKVSARLQEMGLDVDVWSPFVIRPCDSSGVFR
jgi:acetylornithine deacetylase/succinyl-diaminopimelate desuccinylase-like protein